MTRLGEEATTQTPTLDDTNTTSSDSPIDTIGQIFLSSYQLGDINVFHGVPFLSQEGQKWIGFRHEDNSPEKPQIPLWQNQHPPIQPGSLPPAGVQTLPDRSVVEASLAYYKSSEFANQMPVVDPVLFALAIDEAYSPGMSDCRRASLMKAYIFAFLAVGSLIGNLRESVVPDLDATTYEVAHQLAPDLFAARPSTEVVDTLMMLASYALPPSAALVADFQLCRCCTNSAAAIFIRPMSPLA